MRLEEIYKQIQPKIYAFFYVQTRSKEVAEDLTQEVFYLALKGLDTFNNESTFQTWLFGIAKNRLKKHFRNQSYKKKLIDQLPKDGVERDTPEDGLVKKEDKKTLTQAIDLLDDPPKEVVTLRIYGELSFKEIGRLLGKSDNFARVSFHQAKMKIQIELDDRYE